LLKLLAGLALAYAAVCLAVFVLQRRLQYFPTVERPELPAGPPWSRIREVELETADGLRLAAWHWPADPTAPLGDVTVLVLHGNGGHRGHRLGWMQALASTGAAVLIPDYRGYGGNPGAPSEAGLYLDGDAAVRWVRAHPAEGAEGGAARLVLLGQSLGGAVAVELAARHAPDALILQNAAASLVDIAAEAYPWLPARLLMRDRFEAERRIGAVRCPVLAIHGEADRTVPPALGRRLFEAANEPRSWWPVPGAGHNDLLERAGPEHLVRVRAFLEALPPAPGRD
jgi:fermentation-respiration switch protein FrsA (DUF1100 family)